MADTDSLVLVAQSSGKPLEDKDMLGFARAWAKQQYGCAAPTCVAGFNTTAEFIDKLKSYDSIGQLGILCHASGGSLTFPDPDPQHPTGSVQIIVTLSEIIDRLGPDAPEVGTIHLLGCQAGRDPAAIWDFAVGLNARWLIAHNYFHAFQPQHIAIKPGETADTLRDSLGWANGYLLPGTDLADFATKHDKTVQLWTEWFITLEDAVLIDAVDSTERLHAYIQRSRAVRVQVFDRGEAERLTSRFRTPVPVFTQVEIGVPQQ